MRRRTTKPRRGLLGTMGRTAVIAGTATATSKAVSGSMDNAAQQRQQEQQAQAAAMQAQADLEQVKAQLAAMQASQGQSATPPPANATPDLLAQIQQLDQLKQAGVLTEDEFKAAKAKLLFNQ